MPGRTRAFVVCGTPLPGHEIVIGDDKGRLLGDREIGHILIKGPSVMAGYFDNAEATEAVMCTDGFMDTGDMGYWLDGEIVITGRAKDLILHNGRNIWPQDIEWAAEQIDAVAQRRCRGLRRRGRRWRGRCRRPGAMPAASDARSMEELRAMVARRVREVAGVDCEVLLVAPRTLPFTSSGKLSRSGARQRYLQGLADIAVSPPAGLSRESEMAVAS